MAPGGFRKRKITRSSTLPSLVDSPIDFQNLEIPPVVEQTQQEPVVLENSVQINGHSNQTQHENGEGSGMTKKRRGPTYGKELEKINKAGKMQLDIPVDKGRPVCPIQSAKLSSEAGVTVRRFMPVPIKWKEFTKEDKLLSFERMKQKFQINWDMPHVKNSIENRMQNACRQHRYRLHKKFEKFSSPEEAKQNKPAYDNLTQDNWNKLCDEWSTPKFKEISATNTNSRNHVTWTHNKGSRAFVACRHELRSENEEPNRIEFFKATHYSEQKGWTSEAAKNAHNQMVELQSQQTAENEIPKSADEIADEVLGKRSGYIKGLGYGPKPSAYTSSSRTTELEGALKKAQDELQAYKSQLNDLSTQFEAKLEATVKATVEQYMGAVLSNHSSSQSSSPPV